MKRSEVTTLLCIPDFDLLANSDINCILTCLVLKDLQLGTNSFYFQKVAFTEIFQSPFHRST